MKGEGVERNSGRTGEEVRETSRGEMRKKSGHNRR